MDPKALAKLTDQIRSAVSEEHAESVAESLKAIERDNSDMVSSLSAANNESKQRKLKIRELTEEVEGHQATIADLQKKTDTSQVDAELESLRGFKTSTLKAQAESFTQAIRKVAEHPNFANAAGFFKGLPEPGEGGKYDLSGFDASKLEEEDLAHNVTEWGKLQRLNYFDSSSNGQGSGNGSGQGGQQKVHVHGGRSDQTPPDVKEKIGGLKSFAEIKKFQAENS